MTDEELVKRLRSMHWCVTTQTNGVGVSDRAIAPEAADRIEALTEQLEAARADAKEAEAYAEELQGDLTELCRQLLAAEAKLAKAVDALREAVYLLDPDEEDIAKETGLYRIVTTLAEIEGGKP